MCSGLLAGTFNAPQPKGGAATYSQVPTTAGDGFARLEEPVPTRPLSQKAKLFYGIAGGVIAVGAILAITISLTLPVPYTKQTPLPAECTYSGYRLEGVVTPLEQRIYIRPTFQNEFYFTGNTGIRLQAVKDG